MNVVKRAALTAYWRKHAETEQPLKEWFATAKSGRWSSMADIKANYPKASVLNSERVVFDICGGNYRLVVAFKFSARIAWIKFVGTHAEYDRVNARTVEDF